MSAVSGVVTVCPQFGLHLCILLMKCVSKLLLLLMMHFFFSVMSGGVLQESFKTETKGSHGEEWKQPQTSCLCCYLQPC